MEHNVEFLKAVYHFAEGDITRSEFAEALKALETPVSTDDKMWVLNIYRADAKQEPFKSVEGIDFINEFTALIDRTELDKGGRGVDIRYKPDEGHGDASMRYRKIKEVNATMGHHEVDEAPRERSPGVIIYKRLLMQGWRTQSSVAQQMGFSLSSTFRRAVENIAHENGLSQDRFSFPRGKRTYVMMSPQLVALCKELIKHEKHEKRQPGERVKSLFSTSGHRFDNLLQAVAHELTHRHRPVEYAYAMRDVGHGHIATCLMPVFQEVLDRAGVITIRNPDDHRAVKVDTKMIPEDPRILKRLAKALTNQLIERSDMLPGHQPRARRKHAHEELDAPGSNSLSL